MRTAIGIQRIYIAFLGILFFGSCNSDDFEVTKTTLSEKEKSDKKELILKKFEELGLNPSNVSFSDKMVGNSIVVKSIADLDKVFAGDIVGQKAESPKETAALSTFNTRDYNSHLGRMTSSWVQYDYYSGQFPVRGALYLNMNLNFYYSRSLLETMHHEAVTHVFTDLTGFTLGVSYNQAFYFLSSMDRAPYELTVEGFLNYNLFVESVGTVYRQKLITKGRFTPSASKYGGHPSFAFFTSYLQDT